jgi:hypothetical protein
VIQITRREKIIRDIMSCLLLFTLEDCARSSRCIEETFEADEDADFFARDAMRVYRKEDFCFSKLFAQDKKLVESFKHLSVIKGTQNRRIIHLNIFAYLNPKFKKDSSIFHVK